MRLGRSAIWIATGVMLAACSGPDGRTGGSLSCPPCPSNAVCVDDPRDSCKPDAGDANCPAVCASQPCGGIRGLACSQGSTCVDDPRDDCDPVNAADCVGVCAP